MGVFSSDTNSEVEVIPLRVTFHLHTSFSRNRLGGGTGTLFSFVYGVLGWVGFFPHGLHFLSLHR